jgi:hypothetical protein
MTLLKKAVRGQKFNFSLEKNFVIWLKVELFSADSFYLIHFV